MVILIVYLIGLVLVSWLLRNKSLQLRSFLTVGYNYLFIIPLYFFTLLPDCETTAEVLNLLIRCAYQAPKAMTFWADVDLFNDPAITLLFYIVSVYTARTLLLLFARRFMMSLATRLGMVLRRRVIAVCGEAGDAESLIREIRKNDRHAPVLYVPQREQDREADLKVPTETRPWAKFLKAGRDNLVILLPDTNHNNLSRLQELDELGKTVPGLKVTAFLDNNTLRFDDMSCPHIDAYLVSREQLLIRRFLMDDQPLETLRKRGGESRPGGILVPERPFTLAVIGFTPLSAEFLLETWENASFESAAPDRRGFEATVIDGGIGKKRAPLFVDAPRLSHEPAISWVDAEPGTEESFEAVAGKLGALHQVLIATPDTRLNLDIAMRLLRLFKRRGLEQTHPQLVVALFENMGAGAEIFSKEAGGMFLRCNASQFTYSELVLRRTDAEANELHRRYISNTDGGREWNAIGTYLQNSNRAVVWDIPNKLLLAGNLDGKTKEEREQIYWELAKYEHLRWCTYQYTHGWETLPRGELTPDEVARRATKRAAERLHACLVPWDELDDLPQERPGLLKYYDYENVTALFEKEGR